MKKSNISKVLSSVRTSMAKHSPEILTGIGIAGMKMCIRDRDITTYRRLQSKQSHITKARIPLDLVWYVQPFL